MEGSDPNRRDDVLATASAGPRAIRGGAARSGGYVVGLLLSLVSAPLLTRHLGVVDFGKYVAVLSLLAIMALIADAGLTAVGVREAAVRDAAGTTRLMRNIVTLRLLASVAGALFATGFAVVAGYGSPLVLGTLVAGGGVVLTVAQQTYTIPMQVQLRLGLITALEMLRQALTVLALVVLILVGAGLVPLLAAGIPAGGIVLAVTLANLRRTGVPRPGFDRAEMAYLARESFPAAIASVLNSIFYRVAIIAMSLVATGTETGLFSASFRVIEALLAIPALVIGSAYPIMARAAETDQKRLAYALARLFDVSVILGGLLAVGIVVGARPAIDFIAGADYEDAIPVLRVQGAALSVTFLVRLWAGSLWVIRAKRELVSAFALAVTVATVFSVVLGSSHGAMGAAIAMAGSELLLALGLGFGLFRRRPDLRPPLAVVPKVLLAGGAALGTFAIGLPALPALALSVVVYGGLLALLGAIPGEIREAIAQPGALGADSR